jgi:hypothetical protein
MARSKEIMRLHHQNYLQLVSQQNRALYQKATRSQKLKEEDHDTPLPEDETPGSDGERVCKKKLKVPLDVSPRELREACAGCKLNIWNMIHEKNREVQESVKIIFVRLLHLLYGSYDFYKKYPKKEDVAELIAHEMVHQKIKKLEDLSLKDNDIKAIYYKMLKGEHAIRFRFARPEILEAALGKDLAARIIQEEIKIRKANSRRYALTKQEFNTLRVGQYINWIPEDKYEDIFYFKNDGMGTLEALKEPQKKIQAFHKIRYEQH